MLARRAVSRPAAGRLGEITVPTLVVTGDRDVQCTLESSRDIAAGVPGARAVTMPATAHLPNLEKPDDFNGLALEFLCSGEQPASG